MPQEEESLRARASKCNNEEGLLSDAGPPPQRTNLEILEAATRGDEALMAGVDPEKAEYGHPRYVKQGICHRKIK